jgi:hypothetical protein
MDTINKRLIVRIIALITVFFTLTPVTIAVSLFSIAVLAPAPKPPSVLAANTSSPVAGAQVYASLPVELAAISGEVHAQDARVEIIRQYLHSYRSPLEPYATKLVEEADKNELDFRLLTAIAHQESTLCKFIPPESYNCWGWGIHSRGTLGFQSYGEAIETVSQGIKDKYIDEGYTTPDEIMSKYTPMSPGSWAHGVNTFMAEME